MKIETKHTPLPWSVKKLQNEFLVETPKSSWAIRLPLFVFSIEDVEVEANAHLIAAAPELLEAARAVLLAEQDDWREPTRSLAASAARDAIAKAAGDRGEG